MKKKYRKPAVVKKAQNRAYGGACGWCGGCGQLVASALS